MYRPSFQVRKLSGLSGPGHQSSSKSLHYILGYFAQDKGDIDAESIEEFLTSTDTFQLIAIDQKKSVKFTTADDIPEGCSAIIFKKPKGTKIDMTNLAKSLRKELSDGPQSSKNTILVKLSESISSFKASLGHQNF